MPRGDGNEKLQRRYFKHAFFVDYPPSVFPSFNNPHAGSHVIRENIMKKTLLTSLLALAFTPSSFSAENIKLTDIVVTATRTPQPRESVIADVTVINQEEINRAGQSSLAELLQLQAGFEISANGGAGKASNVFLRGTNSSHTLVLIDGLRIQSATAGTTTLENLPLAQIDRIEILRGPATSLYGQDAIGGVVQIFTKKGKPGLQAYANIGYGTYDTKKSSAGVNGKVNSTRFSLNLSAEDTDGFSALDTNNNNLKDKDGYRNVAFNGHITQELAEGHQLGLQFFNSEGDTKFDNRFNTTNFSSNAEIKQQAFSVFTKNQFTDFWLSNLKIGLSKDKLKSYDEFSAPIPGKFNTKQKQLTWQNDFTLPVGTLTLMYDKLEEEVDSNTSYNKTKRSNEAYVVSYLANIGAHSVHVSYRDDHNSSFGNEQTGGLGYGYHFNDYWRATASYGKAFKAPTFNDLYFPDFFGFATSNPNLSPEKSDNIEASLRYENEHTKASITVYENKIRNLIALDAAFVPFNANKATLNGVTLAVNHQHNNWMFAVSADIQSPRDDETNNLLVRRANRHAKVNVGYQWHNLRIGAEAISSSKRYNDTANLQAIAGYTLFNLTSEYTFNPQWKLHARLNNVFDKNYALAYDGNPNAGGFIYNTPGSNLFINLKWQSK
ncbi:MAG: TonB-dependent receptor [Methylophilaceae bacterium]